METAANPSLVITVEVLLRARHSTKQAKTQELQIFLKLDI